MKQISNKNKDKTTIRRGDKYKTNIQRKKIKRIFNTTILNESSTKRYIQQIFKKNKYETNIRQKMDIKQILKGNKDKPNIQEQKMM